MSDLPPTLPAPWSDEEYDPATGQFISRDTASSSRFATDMRFVKRPDRPRWLEVVCTHQGRPSGRAKPVTDYRGKPVIDCRDNEVVYGRLKHRPRTYRFHGKLRLLYQPDGLCLVQLVFSDWATPTRGHPGNRGVVMSFRCPNCRCNLESREETISEIVAVLDAMQRETTGDDFARIPRLDITSAERVLEWLSRYGKRRHGEAS